MLLVGDGPDRAAAERRAAEHGLSDAVTFAGEQHDLVPWLSAADLFLLPSAKESFGLAALEAMACEVPVVTSNVGGLPEIVQDGVNGLLFRMGDVEHLAARTIEAAANPALRHRLGRQARSTVSAMSVDRVVPRYLQVFTETIGAARHHYGTGV